MTIPIKNLEQAQQALNRFISKRPSERRYTLDRMRALMDHLGNPQNNLKVIHVAGTSGKTSTCHYVAALLEEAGFTTGLTVSPHVDTVTERTQINLESLDELRYCKELSRFLGLISSSGLNPSYFEVLIAFSYWLFNEYRVDYAVVEVGVGGLLDGTNVIDRHDKICIITDIGLDHTEVLGDTLEKITEQKAGIIGPNNTVFMHDQGKAIVSAVENICQTNNAKLHLSTYEHVTSETVELPPFQRRNFQLALQASRYVLDRENRNALSPHQVIHASAVYIPARMEIVHYGNKTLVLDGSHNEQKISALTEAVVVQYPKKSTTLLVAFGSNKQATASASLKIMRTMSQKIIITRFDVGQEGVGPSIDPDILAISARDAGFKTIVIEPDPLTAFEMINKDDAKVGVITGSFYLLNHYRKHADK